MKSQKKVIVSVINDLNTDQRVHKVCTSLLNKGYEVQLVGRLLPNSLPLKRAYSTKRFRLWFNEGFLFYATYNIRLLIHLLFHQVDIFLANDLDTLPANFMAARIRKKALVYDSHEFFTEVPELVDRPRIQKIWQNIEELILPKLRHCYTVSSKIQEQYNYMYSIDMKLVRNFPRLDPPQKLVEKKEKVILYQGALNISRGIEEVVLAMQYVDQASLWIAGGGDIENELRDLIDSNQLQEKVKLLGRLPLEELKNVTQRASLGVSLEKKEGLNYQYALPNKIFDYTHAGVPVLYADLPVINQTLEGFQIGERLKSYEAKELAKQIQSMLASPNYTQWVNECERAKLEFNWEKEEQTLFAIFEGLEHH